MALRTDEVQLRVLIDGTPARKELAELSRDSYKLRDEQKKLQEQEKTMRIERAKHAKGSPEYRAITKDLLANRKAQEEMSEALAKGADRQAKLRKEIGLTALSAKELRTMEKQISAQLNVAGGDPAKRATLEKELVAIQAELNKTHTAIARVDRVWAVMRKDMRLDAMTLKQLDQEIGYLKRLKREVQETDPAFKSLSRSIAAAEARKTKLESGLGPFGRAWQGVKSSVMGAVAAIGAVFAGGALIEGVRGLVKSSADLSDTQADVQRTTGLTKREVSELTSELGRLDTRTARSELLALAADAGKLGITGKENVLQFVRAGDKIRVALGEDLGDDAIKSIGKLNQTFKVGEKTGKDMETQMLSTGSAINALGQASTASESFLVDFATRQSGVNEQSGISLQNTLGYAAALDQLGQQAETSSTAMGEFTTKAFTNTATYAKIAGMELDDFQQLLRTDVNEALLKTLEGLNGNGAGMQEMVQKFGLLDEEGTRAISVLSSLASNTQLVREQQAIANAEFEKGTSITNEFNTKNSTLGAQVEKLGKEINRAFTSRAIVDFVSSMVTALREAVTWLKEKREAIVAVGKTLAIVGSTLAGYRLAIIAASLATRAAAAIQAAFGTVMALVRGEITLASSAMGAFNTVTKLNPIGLVVGAITAAIGVFAAFGDTIRGISDGMRTLLGEREQLNALFGAIKTANEATGDRARLIKELNETYGQYLPNQLSETANLRDIEQAQIAANGALVKRIELEAKRSVLQEKMNAAVEAQAEVDRAKLDLEKAKDNAGGFQVAAKDGETPGSRAIAKAERDLRAAMKEAEELSQDYQKAYTALGGAGLEPPKARPASASPTESVAPTTTGETPEQKAAREAAEKAERSAKSEAAKKAEDDLAKHMEALAKITAQARENALLSDMSADEKEIEQLREKHRSELKEAREHTDALVKAGKLTPAQGVATVTAVENDQVNAEANLIEAQGEKRVKAEAEANAKYIAERQNALKTIADSTHRAHIDELEAEVAYWDERIAEAQASGKDYAALEENRFGAQARLTDALATEQLDAEVSKWEGLITVAKSYNLETVDLERALARAKTAIQRKQLSQEEKDQKAHNRKMREAAAGRLRDYAQVAGGFSDLFQGIQQLREAEVSAEEARADADGVRTKDEIARIEERKEAARRAALTQIQVQMAIAIASGVANAMTLQPWPAAVAAALSTVGIVMGLMAQASSLMNQGSSSTTQQSSDPGNVQGVTVGADGVREFDLPSHSEGGANVVDAKTGRVKYNIEGGETLVAKDVGRANPELMDELMHAAHRTDKRVRVATRAGALGAAAGMALGGLVGGPIGMALGGAIGGAIAGLAAIPMKKQKNPGVVGPGTDEPAAQQTSQPTYTYTFRKGGSGAEGAVITGDIGGGVQGGSLHSDGGNDLVDTRTGEVLANMERDELLLVMSRKATEANADLIPLLLSASRRGERFNFLNAPVAQPSTSAMRVVHMASGGGVYGTHARGTPLVNATAPTGSDAGTAPLDLSPLEKRLDKLIDRMEENTLETRSNSKAFAQSRDVNFRFDQAYARAKRRAELLFDRNTAKRHRA